nr:fimbrillin family protein [Hoylesella enoeca]
MKTTILSTTLSAIMLLFATACTNEHNEDSDLTPENKQVQFKLNFTDYGEDQEFEGTRASFSKNEVKKQMVDLGNGILAEVTVQRDTTKTTETASAATRAMENGHYTILAYQGGTCKGEIKGQVYYGTFTPDPGTKDRFRLPHGIYTFVCFNDKVTRSGDQLTITRDNAEKAMIGITKNYNINTDTPMEVSFTMKHVGARMRIKLTAYMNISTATKASIADAAGDVPTIATYDLTTDSYTYSNGSTSTGNYTFNTSGGQSVGTYYPLANKTSLGYQYFLPTTDGAKLKLTFTDGSIYGRNMAGASLILNPSPSLNMVQNGSYLVNVKLLYHFLYLFSDGTTGLITESTYGGGTKIPVGVVLSQSKRMAIALKNANNDDDCEWCYSTNWSLAEQKSVSRTNNFAALCNMENGYEETWNASASTDGVTVKGDTPDFQAFYAAGHYDPGTPVSGSLVGKKWYLPAMGEWKYVYSALGLINHPTITSDYQATEQWPSGSLVNAAFNLVGGTDLHGYNSGIGGTNAPAPNMWYWSSSEYSYYSDQAGYIWMGWSAITFHYNNRGGKRGSPNRGWVRPFIRY